ncbi:MAG: SMI1/KNR4 family protein, partial [Muribaculaceae bacterium]|nr:SMI1/KNR4 family protein [Muribaculaceae bacterium]
MTQVFEDFDFTNFWEDSQYARTEYIGNRATDELIAGVEQELGYKLPASY